MKYNRNKGFVLLLLLCVMFCMFVSCEETPEKVGAETETVSPEYVYTLDAYSVPQTSGEYEVGFFYANHSYEKVVSDCAGDTVQLYGYTYTSEENPMMMMDENGIMVETGTIVLKKVKSLETAVWDPNVGETVLKPFPFDLKLVWGEKEWRLNEHSFGGFTRNDAGDSVYLLRQFNHIKESGTLETTVYIVYYNADGTLKYNVSTAGYPGMAGYPDNSENLNPNVCLTEDGYLLFMNWETLVVLDPDGQYVTHKEIVPFDGVHPFLELHRAKDGSVFILYQGRNDPVMQYVTVDTTTWETSAPQDFPLAEGERGKMMRYSFLSKDVFFVDDGLAMYRCDMQGNQEKLFSWMDFGVVGASIDGFYARDEHNFFVLSHDPLTDAPEILTVDYVDRDTLPEKTEIVIACGDYSTGAMQKLQTAVTLFNRRSTDYKAKIVAYDPEKESAFSLNQQIATDMMQGAEIDLILFQNDITMEYFDNLGLLGDWYSMIDADADYPRDKFLPCILRAYETTDGTLPVLTTDFGLTTLIGAAENLPSMEQWTYSDCRAYLKTLDWDQILLQLDKEKDEQQSDAMLVFQSFLPMILDDYIDMDAGTCSFDSDSFRQLLSLCSEVMINHEAAALKFADGAEQLVWEGIGYLREYQQGKTLLFNEKENLNVGKNSIIHPWSMMNVLLNFFPSYDGEINMIGYPMPDGVTDHGTAVTPHIQFGLTASAAHKEVAWEFVKTYLDYQCDRRQDGVNALPCTREALDALYDAYLTYEYLASGTPWLQEYTDRNDNGKDSPYYHDADPRACDLLDDLLAKTTRRYSGNTAIMNILYEEAVYFFDGIQPMEEVTKRMQSRVGIYLSEHQ